MDYNGAKIVCDVYISNEDTVSLKKCNVSDKDVEYTYGNKIYDNGDVVYFDVTTGKTCDNYTEENSNTGYNGINGTGNQNSCLKFYAFNDFGSDKLNLLLDHNTTATIAWNLSGSNINGPSEEFLNKLNEDTKNWIGTDTLVNYSINLNEGYAQYQIDYSDYKARIITANEIAIITENTTWNETTSNDYYYFDSKLQYAKSTCKKDSLSGCAYGWLYDRTSINCKDYGCLNNSDKTTTGYWTISPRASNLNYTWTIYYQAYIDYISYVNYASYGIRPVIEVLRLKLK